MATRKRKVRKYWYARVSKTAFLGFRRMTSAQYKKVKHNKGIRYFRKK